MDDFKLNLSDSDDLSIAEANIWQEYTASIDDLHRAAMRLDRSGRMGYVYLAKMSMPDDDWQSETSRIKIGIAKNPSERIKHWSHSRVKMPYRISELHSAWVEDARATEAALHRVFHRYRTAGEWFNLPDKYVVAMLGLWYVRGTGRDRLWFYDLLGHGFPLMGFLRSEIRKDEADRRIFASSWRQSQETEAES